MKLADRISSMILVLSFILITYVMYQLYHPIKIIEFKDDKFKIIKPVVKAGGTVCYAVNIVKYKDIPAIMSRQLVNGYSYSITTTESNLPKGNINIIESVELPKYVEPGKYHIITTYTYNINKFRSIVYTHNTEEFEVI